jgi:hypothetical protein
MKSNRWVWCGVVPGCVVALVIGQRIALWAQQTERPGTSRDNPAEMPRDLTGLSIKNPRVRVVHTTDPAQSGGSMYLQQVDPCSATSGVGACFSGIFASATAFTARRGSSMARRWPTASAG